MHISFVCEYAVQLKKKIFIVETNMRKKSYEKCHRKFRIQFLSVSVPSESKIHQTVNKFQISSFLNKMRQQTWCVLSEQTIDDVTAWLETSPWDLQDSYHRKLVCQSHLYMQPQPHNYFTWNHTNLQPCKKFHEAGCVITIQFCNWLCEAVCSGEADPLLNYFTDEACFT
jgi:hypothetical protein